MDVSARQCLCARCRVAFLICRRCDRGQRYCGPHCATTARRERRRASNRRDQNTFRGRLFHARRQHRLRERQQKVTDQGSVAGVRDGVLAPGRAVSGVDGMNRRPFPSPSWPHCHFCGHRCTQWVRFRFLRPGSSCVFPRLTLRSG